MRLASAIGAAAFVWTLSVAHAQQGASAPGAAPSQATVATPVESLGDDSFADAFDIRPTGPRDARELQAARRNIQALERAARAALGAFYNTRPRGAEVELVDGAVVFIANGRTLSLSPEQQRMLDAFRAANGARRTAVIELAMSALSEHDLSAVSAARAAQGGGAAARQAYQALVERLRDKVRIRAFAERGTMRIVRDPALIGVERVIESPPEKNPFVKPERKVLFSQPLAFNRLARLTQDLTVKWSPGWFNRKPTVTLARGTTMFVAVMPDGLDAYCPLFDDQALAAEFYYGDYKYFPCYADADFDGSLESQFSGGEMVDGMHAVGPFNRIGTVLTPAQFEEIPSADGPQQQRAGVEALENNLSPGLQEVILGQWIAYAEGGMRLPIDTLRGRRRVLLRRGVSTTVEIGGARVELRYTGNRTIAFKILECLPEHPLTLAGQL